MELQVCMCVFKLSLGVCVCMCVFKLSLGWWWGTRTNPFHSELTIILTSVPYIQTSVCKFPQLFFPCYLHNLVGFFNFFFLSSFFLTRIQRGPFRVVVHTLKTAFGHFVSFSRKVWEGRWIMEAGFESLDG